MKRLQKNDELCIGCGVCEVTCSKAFFKEDIPEKSRIRVHKEGDKYKISTCTQCGVCVNECPVQALKPDSRGVIRLNNKDCVGCNMCVGYCPEEIMVQHDDHLEPFKCIACGLCVKQCPTGAIEIIESDV